MVSKGGTREVLKAWLLDPQVTLDGDSKGSIFDAFAD